MTFVLGLAIRFLCPIVNVPGSTQIISRLTVELSSATWFSRDGSYTSSRVIVKLPSVVAFNSSLACTVDGVARGIAFVIKCGRNFECAVDIESKERIIIIAVYKAVSNRPTLRIHGIKLAHN